MRLAGLGIGDPSTAMSQAYVRALFDEYAPRFERHLVEDLGYCAPQLLLDTLDVVSGLSKQYDVALDLGCGTGLTGDVLRARVGTLVGVDLSPAMLALARRKNIYDRLVEDDLVVFLDREPGNSADLVMATDVLIYLGNLDPLLTGVAQVLKRGGHVAVSIQSLDGGDLRLGADGRFSHGDGCVRESAARHGFRVAAEEVCEIRRERGRGVPGRIIVLRKA